MLTELESFIYEGYGPTNEKLAAYIYDLLVKMVQMPLYAGIAEKLNFSFSNS